MPSRVLLKLPKSMSYLFLHVFCIFHTNCTVPPFINVTEFDKNCINSENNHKILTACSSPLSTQLTPVLVSSWNVPIMNQTGCSENWQIKTHLLSVEFAARSQVLKIEGTLQHHSRPVGGEFTDGDTVPSSGWTMPNNMWNKHMRNAWLLKCTFLDCTSISWHWYS